MPKNNLFFKKVKRSLWLLSFSLLGWGCQTHPYLITESFLPVSDHRRAIVASVGEARIVSQNGREILSKFYDRKDKMNFSVTSQSSIGREDNLFDLLSTNPKSDQEYQRIQKSHFPFLLRQSFQSAAKIFRAIDSPGRGVVVPYGEEGKLLSSKDLDECHGHTHPVLWDGVMTNIYHYHWTYDFPYNIGCFKGTPQ